ncbi:hypothetical protein B296_00028422 [Ensete ventricosum]|uniref:Uncharacterized protein n=1 Tax=Ensete ventricosum TaxID=4639 RepID=A0A426X7L6_ENSVE|nr:hypothetical protein B296_00028422 [Ensete ventricosum]
MYRQPGGSRQPQQPVRRTTSTTAAKEPTEQLKQAKSIPSSPTKSHQPQEPLKAGVTPAEVVAAQLLPSSSNTETTALQPTAAGDKEASQAGVVNTTDKENPMEDANLPPVQEKPIEEAIRVTRARMRKRAATAGPSAR